MTDDAYGSTIAKRRLSERLAELRLASDYTANHVCDILNWGRGKVGRFEANQWKRPEMSDVRDLLRIYGVSGSAADEVEELAMKARARPWWRDSPEIFDSEFPGYENDATSIGVFMPLILPGLLQTEAYIESLLRTGPRPPQWRRKALAARLRRQEILDRSDGTPAPQVTAVITEASLLYRWGTMGDRQEQIAHLIEVARNPDVELRVQRFKDGPPSGAHSMVNLFGFGSQDPSLVFVETDYAIEEVSKREAVNGYVQSFKRACDGALDPGDTVDHLEHLADQLE
jgi:transcriptional regulator with XRE-family HTH domain